MLEELKTALAREGVSIAEIIDDVYDQIPARHDIPGDAWDIFETDLTEQDVAAIGSEFAIEDVYGELLALKTRDDFLLFLWQQRHRSGVFESLFKEFNQKRSAGEKTLAPLAKLLSDAGVTVRTSGSRDLKTDQTRQNDAHIIFLDLFLGPEQDGVARERAIERIKSLTAGRRSNPPLVILMSMSTRLANLKDDCRDEAELLGCQFRTLEKQEIGNRDLVLELLYRLVSRYRDTTMLAQFLETWRGALAGAQKRFLSKVRRLDLRDYADLHELVLKTEGERVGDYLLETYDQFFHSELEADDALGNAAKDMDAVNWNDYPLPHFLPEDMGGEIVDAVLFHHVKWVGAEGSLQFGDVLFVDSRAAWSADREPKVDWVLGERLALLLLTQACDIQQCKAKQLLFMAGVAKPAALVFHRRPNPLQTPILRDGERRYVVEWEVGAPLTWAPREVENLRANGSMRRVRRFRSLYALQLQECFAGALSRVGTPVMLPPRYVAGVNVTYRDTNGNLQALVVSTISERDAVVLVGRDESQTTDYLALSGRLLSRLRTAMDGVSANISEKSRKAWDAALANRIFFRRLEQGITYNRSGLTRPFLKSDWDVLQIVGPYAKSEQRPSSTKKDPPGPLLIEVVVGPEPNLSERKDSKQALQPSDVDSAADSNDGAESG